MKFIYFTFLIIFKVFKALFKSISQLMYFIFSIEFKWKLFSFKTLVFLVIVIVSYISIYFYINIFIDIPYSVNLEANNRSLTSKIFDRKGNLLYEFYKDQNRELIALSDVPKNFINATIAIEDKDFYNHNGISISGILRAIKKTAFNNDVEGGSTITQQLVKNKLLSNEKTIIRKIREAILALKLERRYTKNQILEMYFNEINYGGTSFGISSAAKTYFDKNVSELNLAESAMLAGLPASPSLYSPLGANGDLAKFRQKEVLRRMLEDGYISKIEFDSAINYPIEYTDQVINIKYPHFVNYVKSELEKIYGADFLQHGGLRVYTSLDPEIQNNAEQIVIQNLTKLKAHNVSNGAALITNPETGEILAMVGSRDFWDKSIDGNVNITTSLRQPGSSIKPINYSLAFDMGYSPYDKILDEPVIFKQPVPPDYSPVNYDHKFHGLITLSQALANSFNVPAVKLLNETGIDNYINHAKKMGITSWGDRSRYGLSLALGAGEVKMVDMNTVYSAFATGGYKIVSNPFLRITANDGRILQSNDCIKRYDEPLNSILNNANNDLEPQNCLKERVISTSTAYQISNILSNNRERTMAFGPNSNLDIKRKKVSVKTGTTTNEKDNWAIGFTKNYLVSSWIGNNKGDRMRNIQSGYTSASLIWRGLFDYLIDTKDVQDQINIPDGYAEVLVCPITNTLACNGCANVKKLYKIGEEPQNQCDYKLLSSINNYNKSKLESTKNDKKIEEKKNL